MRRVYWPTNTRSTRSLRRLGERKLQLPTAVRYSVPVALPLILFAVALQVRWLHSDPLDRFETALAGQMDFDNGFTCRDLGFAIGTAGNAACRAQLSRAEDRYLWRRADAYMAVIGEVDYVPLPAHRNPADR